MLYLIERVSDYEIHNSMDKPHPNAYEGLVTRSRLSESERKVWFVEIETLEELMSFIESIECKVIIYGVKDPSNYWTYPLIAIYDGHNE